MSKRNIFTLMLALGLVGVMAFCISSSIIRAGGGGIPGEPICDEECTEIFGDVTYATYCEHKTGDYVEIKWKKSICEWHETTTSIQGSDPYYYSFNLPDTLSQCEIYVKGVCGNCAGCASIWYMIDRQDTCEQDIYMDGECECQ